jgi:predicted membrane channel-forming protein YqfA (hemolysin III family)
VKLDEPVTTLGDYALSVLLIVLGVLTPLMSPAWPSVLWAAAFIASAVAAALGGTSHGFGPRLSARLAAQVWRATLLAAVGANCLLLLAVTIDHAPGALVPLLVALAAAKCATAVALAWRRPEYRVVIYDSAVTIAVVLLVEIARLAEPGASWIVAGGVLATVGALVQRSGFRRSRPWNHNDAYHLIQAAAFYGLFRGATA